MRNLMLRPLEALINGYLSLDEDAIAELATLTDKRILVEIEDWRLHFFITPTNNGVVLNHTLDKKPTTCLRGPLSAFIQLSRSKVSSADLFKSHLHFSGDLETGEKLRKIFSELDIDWEEKLSTFTGDLVAHKAGNFVRSIGRMKKHTEESLSTNLSDYLHHEIKLLPTRNEVTTFLNEVSRLRDQIERLEARLNLLAKKEGQTT